MTATAAIAMPGTTLRPARRPGPYEPQVPSVKDLFIKPPGLRTILRIGILTNWMMAAAGLTGCNGSPPPPGYLPEWAEARQSLESALSAWRDAPLPLPDSFDSASVIFVDKQRPPGLRLRSFAILGQSEIENARQFTVRLQLDQEESPRLVRYNIVGRNPVWVFRLEDYERISHWEHSMDDPSTAPTTDRPGK
jgi:hypothetical protein